MIVAEQVAKLLHHNIINNGQRGNLEIIIGRENPQKGRSRGRIVVSSYT